MILNETLLNDLDFHAKSRQIHANGNTINIQTKQSEKIIMKQIRVRSTINYRHSNEDKLQSIKFFMTFG